MELQVIGCWGSLKLLIDGSECLIELVEVSPPLELDLDILLGHEKDLISLDVFSLVLLGVLKDVHEAE